VAEQRDVLDVPGGKLVVVGVVYVPTPAGPMPIEIKMESETLVIDTDTAMDAAARGLANLARNTIRANWKTGRDAQGKSLPPLKPATRERRVRRVNSGGRMGKTGRAVRPVVSTSIPMHETGWTGGLMKVTREGPAQYAVSTWIFEGALNAYGDEALMDYPKEMDEKANAAIQKALDKAVGKVITAQYNESLTEPGGE
jgi:hypothetical protein